MTYTINKIILPDTKEEVTYITKTTDSGVVTFLADENSSEYQRYIIETGDTK